MTMMPVVRKRFLSTRRRSASPATVLAAAALVALLNGCGGGSDPSTLTVESVTRIERDAAGNFTRGTGLLTRISTGGDAIAGVTLSPDGRRLYVTTEIQGAGTRVSGKSNPVLGRTGCVQNPGGATSINGMLSVVDVAAAESGKREGAIIATVAAGCSPVRIDVSADGKTVWIAARGDNRVLAFNADRLEATPDDALVGYADTGGIAPVGIKLFSAGRLLAVANSNRFDGGRGNLTILDVRDAANAQVVDTVATGLFPRNITVGTDDSTLYLTNFQSASFQVIRTRVR